MPRSTSGTSSDSDHAETRQRRSDNDNNEAPRISVEIILGLAQTFLASSDMRLNNETEPLLRGQEREEGHAEETQCESDPRTRGAVWGGLTVVFVAALVFILFLPHLLPNALYPWLGLLPKDPLLAALRILDNSPIIDGHIDLPILVRYGYANNVSAVDLLSPMPGHVDIPRLRLGKVGGFFWSVYVSCAKPEDEGKDFINATWRVRDTLEQIDVSRLLMAKYPDVSLYLAITFLSSFLIALVNGSQTFQFALGSEDIKSAINNGKIASLLGVEGAHQLGNSISVLRQYHALGVRYVTLTHTCHNAFADSCGSLPEVTPLHSGLSALGRSLIDEMNRIGVLVDLSHTSDATAAQALNHSKAPVIWSHSSARAVHDVPRNVPDDILRLVGTGDGQKDAVVMINFASYFVATPGNATVQAVVDHVEHIANISGKKHVGLGSDFDGIEDTPTGLEDVSKYPALIAELYKRGWNKYDLAGLAGANLLRVFEGAERIARELQGAGTLPVFDLYDKRATDSEL